MLIRGKGYNCTVDARVIAIKKNKYGETIYKNPAKKLEF